MYFWLPLSFLLLQAGLLLLPHRISAPAAYLSMVTAPVLTALALWWRADRHVARIQNAWRLLALAALIWAVGAGLNFWHEWWQGRNNEMFADAILMFQLFAVPMIYLITIDPHASSRYLVRAIDGLQALVLGYVYFLVTWSLLNERGAPDEQGVIALIWMIDLQTLYVTLGALLRWHAASERAERGLYGVITAFSLLYLLLAFINNHYIGNNADFGPQLSSMATLAFALLTALALRPPAQLGTTHSVNPLLRRVVYSACPMLLTITLVVVSLLLMRSNYVMGVAGVAIGVLSFGLRNVLTQLRQLERGEALQHQHSQLEAIAWTDALTGVANRHFLEHTLRQTWLSTPPQGRAMAVLMIDVDHFKRLNDAQGHGVGDACLRQVASTLHQALARPGDLLARYGGEEFIALLHNADRAGALTVAERMRAAVEQLGIEHTGGIMGRVSVSIGCATGPIQDESQARALIERADQALYAAKALGRNRVEM